MVGRGRKTARGSLDAGLSQADPRHPEARAQVPVQTAAQRHREDGHEDPGARGEN